MSETAAAAPSKVRAGVIGLGMIGGGIAVSLARSGIPASAVYDVRPDAAAPLPGVPAQVLNPAGVAAVSDVVILAVVDASQAEEALNGPEGVLSEAREDMVVVLVSTVSIEAVRHLADLCAGHGVSFVDAGVTGGSKAAENGLVVMVGGAEQAVQTARPVLEAFGKTVVHCGELGTGMVAKLARNALTYSVWAAVREATSIAVAGNVPLDRLLTVLEEGNDEGTAPLSLLHGQVAGLTVPAERLESADLLAQKDLAAAQEFAGTAGIELPIVDVVKPRMRDVYSGRLPERLPEDRWQRGLAMMDRTYGPGFSDQVPAGIMIPSVIDTVEHLFGEIWSRGYLTMRDRRLLTLGATAMLGRGDLLETQFRGAASHNEFTVDQLREIVLHLHYYASWENGGTLQDVVEKLIAEKGNL